MIFVTQLFPAHSSQISFKMYGNEPYLDTGVYFRGPSPMLSHLEAGVGTETNSMDPTLLR